MFVRQVKRKCSVRGCKNTDCFAISRTREVGNTVIICKTCLADGLAAIGEIDPKMKSNISVPDSTEAPPLFFNAKALFVEENTAEDLTEFKCSNCGKEFDNEKGLKTHLRYCKDNADKE